MRENKGVLVPLKSDIYPVSYIRRFSFPQETLEKAPTSDTL